MERMCKTCNKIKDISFFEKSFYKDKVYYRHQCYGCRTERVGKRKKINELDVFPFEVWMPIKNYESLYEISDFGRIKSLIQQYITYGSGNKGEYKRFVLHNKDKKKTYKRIHQLVAEAFIPNPENKPEVNHKDGNKSNNHVSNLEWATRLENNTHSIVELKRYFYKKISDDAVRELRSSGLSNSELSKIHGIDYRYVWAIRNGKSRHLV